jgi:hypothetical protein
MKPIPLILQAGNPEATGHKATVQFNQKRSLITFEPDLRNLGGRSLYLTKSTLEGRCKFSEGALIPSRGSSRGSMLNWPILAEPGVVSVVDLREWRWMLWGC